MRARLVAEYLSAMRVMPVAAALQLEALGISRIAIAAVCPAPMRIVVNRAGCRFRPDDRGEWGWVFPVTAVDPGRPELIETKDPFAAIQTGPVVDLAGRIGSPAAPGRWALRRGFATVVGAIEPQFMDPAPVRVHRDVGGWLLAGCAGIALLTDERDERERVLGQIRHAEFAAPIASMQLPRSMSRRRVEELVRKIITANPAQREGALRWACRELGAAARNGEIRAQLAGAILVRTGIRAGLGEAAAGRVVAASFGETKGEADAGEWRWPRPS
jgi:hypothetical protein